MWLFVSIIIISTISVVYCSVKGGDMMEDSKEVATSYYRNRGETGHIPRFTSTTRVAYIDDNPRDQKSYRYYGTGSKCKSAKLRINFNLHVFKNIQFK